ncbi:HNH endonuclease [Mycolicibacterium mucogenicum]|uniref:HNH endonuclease n=1 Tax=Mycolicibacterium mucogenicum TaxID=56689 RepID=A0A1A3GQ09_MYCMU|nr:HNH endonuclease [Mycolicibacterium mucogenicum]OBJ38117.1 HNH endonuclease [Mycolicibacterium mucogenicum]
MRSCQGCGSPLVKRSQRVYCSNACQASARSDARTKRWLETGEAYVATYHDHYIRRYLADAQSGCCAICGGDTTWQDLPLALVLDHIDGDPTNNRRENLRLICPNCDSQLPTYKSRNRGNGRHFRRARYANGQSY